MSSQLIAGTLEWHTFLQVGLAMSDSEYVYDHNIHQDPNFTRPSLLGLELAQTIHQEWKLQGLLVSRMQNDHASVHADRAYLRYQKHACFSASIGRQSLPFFIYSEDILKGRAYPWAEPPLEVYKVVPARSFDGVALHGTFDLGGDLQLHLEPYHGNLALDPEFTPNQERVDKLSGLRLRLSLDVFELFTSYASATVHLKVPTLENRRLSASLVGFQSHLGQFTLLGEYVYTQDHSKPTYAQGAIANFRAYYLTASYRVLKHFLLHYTQSEAKTPMNPVYDGSQSSKAYGINYELSPEASLKFEYTHIDLKEGQNGLFSAKEDRLNTQPVEDKDFVAANVLKIYYTVTL